MMLRNLTREGRDASRKRMGNIGKLGAAAAALLPLGGCVQLTAPERPIEINLNINIRQEVVVRLQQDVRELIQENPGVF
jgi:hypothetical protein